MGFRSSAAHRPRASQSIIRGMALLLMLFCATTSFAESLIIEADVVGTGGGAHQNVVRASSGDLFAVSIVDEGVLERELRVYRSVDQGVTWTLEPVVLNDAATGLSGTELANAASVTIDQQDRLHVVWGRYYYPSFFTQYYRNYQPTSGDLSTIVDLSATVGADPLDRTAANSIAVDQDGTVWIVAQGVTSWVERLLRSTDAYAASLTFEDLGPLSPTASAQNSRIAVDASGRVHCVYYRNVAPGNYEHRIYDPVAGWLPSVVIGDTTGTNDFYGNIVTDSLGGAHAMVAKNGTAGSTWEFIYRSWDELAGWSGEVPVFTATEPEYTGIANDRVFSLVCDEMTGDVTAFYRDLPGGGALRTATKAASDSSFTPGAELQPPSSEQHYYYQLTARGTLYPASNQARHGLDLSWVERPASPPYRHEFERAGGASGGPQFRRGDANDDGLFDVSDCVYSLAALIIVGAPQPPCIAAGDANGDGLFDISDPVFALAAIFIPGSPTTPAPGSMSCGVDPNPVLACDTYTSCP